MKASATLFKSVCFPDNTAVLTNYGFVPIQDIQVGDSVWTYSTETGRKELSAVSNIFARKSENFVKLHFGTDSVACTPEHPFFVNNTWREAKDLKAGDSLFAYSGYKVALDSINTYKTDTATTVYNLEASGNHNFYVSASSVLVHNCNNIVKSGFRYSKHALERMAENNITESMVKMAIEKGVKYYNPKNGTYNYILKNGFASGKNFIVGQNTIDGTITTVGRYRNIPAGLIKVK